MEFTGVLLYTNKTDNDKSYLDQRQEAQVIASEFCINVLKIWRTFWPSRIKWATAISKSDTWKCVNLESVSISKSHTTDYGWQSQSHIQWTVVIFQSHIKWTVVISKSHTTDCDHLKSHTMDCRHLKVTYNGLWSSQSHIQWIVVISKSHTMDFCHLKVTCNGLWSSKSLIIWTVDNSRV